MSKFDNVEIGAVQKWWISVDFATIQANTVQEKGCKRIVRIAPIFGGFEGKDLSKLLAWVNSHTDKMEVEELT